MCLHRPVIASGPILTLNNVQDNERGSYICCMIARVQQAERNKPPTPHYICSSSELQISEPKAVNTSLISHQQQQQQHSYRKLVALAMLLFVMLVLLGSFGCLFYLVFYKKRVRMFKRTQQAAETLKKVSAILVLHLHLHFYQPVILFVLQLKTIEPSVRVERQRGR